MTKQETKNQKRKQLEKRLKDAFPDRWKQLSEDEKTAVIDKFFYFVWEKRPKIGDALQHITNKRFSIGIFFLGTLFALVVGLCANIIHDWFSRISSPWNIVYISFIVTLLVILIWKIDKLFEEMVNDDYRDSHFLDGLLTEVEKDKTSKVNTIERRF